MSLQWSDLRLLLVGPLPPPSGGMAMQTLQLADLLRREGARVEIVQTNAAYRPAWLGRVWGVRAVVRFVPYLSHLWRATGRANLVHVMGNSGLAWHLFAAPAVRIARWRSKPVVVNYRGGGAAAFLERSAPSVRRVLSGAQLVVPSGFLEKLFGAHGMAARTVPNIVDLTTFHPAVDRPGGLHIVVTRNLEPIYDVGTALAAFRIVQDAVPGARMTIAGSGPELASLQRQARELGIDQSVAFSGRLERASIAALYRSATIALNPSRVDNMPNSILEAMASGVPVVSTDVGGVPYVVEHGVTARLVPAGDAVAMAASILGLHQDATAWGLQRDKALADVQRYAWPIVREHWLACYAAALDGRGGQS